MPQNSTTHQQFLAAIDELNRPNQMGQINPLRVLIQDAPGSGHQVNPVNVVKSIRNAGFAGSIEIIYQVATTDRIRNIFAIPQTQDIHEGFQLTDQQTTFIFYTENYFREHMAEFAHVPLALLGSDPVNQQPNYSTQLKVDSVVIVPPRGWDNTQLIDNSKFNPETLEDTINNYVPNRSFTIQDAINAIPENQLFDNKGNALCVLLHGIANGKLRHHTLYGFNYEGASIDDPAAPRLQVLINIMMAHYELRARGVDNDKPMIISYQQNITPEELQALEGIIARGEWPTTITFPQYFIDYVNQNMLTLRAATAPNNFKAVFIDNPEASEYLETLAPNNVLFLVTGRLPQAIFDWLLPKSYYPPTTEGANSINSLLSQTKIFMKDGYRDCGNLENWGINVNALPQDQATSALLTTVNQALCPPINPEQTAGFQQAINAGAYLRLADFMLAAKQADSALTRFFDGWFAVNNAPDNNKVERALAAWWDILETKQHIPTREEVEAICRAAADGTLSLPEIANAEVVLCPEGITPLSLALVKQQLERAQEILQRWPNAPHYARFSAIPKEVLTSIFDEGFEQSYSQSVPYYTDNRHTPIIDEPGSSALTANLATRIDEYQAWQANPHASVTKVQAARLVLMAIAHEDYAMIDSLTAQYPDLLVDSNLYDQAQGPYGKYANPIAVAAATNNIDLINTIIASNNDPVNQQRNLENLAQFADTGVFAYYYQQYANQNVGNYDAILEACIKSSAPEAKVNVVMSHLGAEAYASRTSLQSLNSVAALPNAILREQLFVRLWSLVNVEALDRMPYSLAGFITNSDLNILQRAFYSGLSPNESLPYGDNYPLFTEATNENMLGLCIAYGADLLAFAQRDLVAATNLLGHFDLNVAAERALTFAAEDPIKTVAPANITAMLDAYVAYKTEQLAMHNTTLTANCGCLGEYYSNVVQCIESPTVTTIGDTWTTAITITHDNATESSTWVPTSGMGSFTTTVAATTSGEFTESSTILTTNEFTTSESSEVTDEPSEQTLSTTGYTTEASSAEESSSTTATTTTDNSSEQTTMTEAQTVSNTYVVSSISGNPQTTDTFITGTGESTGGLSSWSTFFNSTTALTSGFESTTGAVPPSLTDGGASTTASNSAAVVGGSLAAVGLFAAGAIYAGVKLCGYNKRSWRRLGQEDVDNKSNAIEMTEVQENGNRVVPLEGLETAANTVYGPS
ncbi:MAG: hypothetical protein Tsb005_15220 [Gammaproteobacteria bacterium]